MLLFVEGRKLESPEKKTLRARTTNKLNPHDTVLESNPCYIGARQPSLLLFKQGTTPSDNLHGGFLVSSVTHVQETFYNFRFLWCTTFCAVLLACILWLLLSSRFIKGVYCTHLPWYQTLMLNMHSSYTGSPNTWNYWIQCS